MAHFYSFFHFIKKTAKILGKVNLLNGTMGELFYTIVESPRTEKNDVLVIKIQEAERDGFLFKPLQNQRPLTRELLNSLATAKDTSILPFLIKSEADFAKECRGRILDEKRAHFNLIHILLRYIPQSLKLFAMTGKLYHKEKALTIDLFGKNEFYYIVESSEEGPKPKGYIKAGSQEFPLSSCDFIGRGPPHWFIKGIQLKCLSTEIIWKDFKAAFEGTPLNLESLVEDTHNDPTAPRIVFQEAAASISSREPLPILILKDRLGAFASLQMDYGSNASLISYEDSTQAVFDKSGKPFCKRQQSIEAGWEKDLFETDFVKKNIGTSHYYCPLDKVAKSIAFLLEIGWQVRDSQGNRVLSMRHTDLHAEMSTQNIAIKGKVHYDTFQADLATVMGAFNRRERFVEILPGHVGLLPNQWQQADLEFLSEEGEIVSDTILIKRNSIGTLSGLFDSHPQIGLDSILQGMREKIENFQGLAEAPPGPNFKGILRPYQQTGLNWLSFLYEFSFHGILADDMGLGKTIQVLAFLSRIEISAPVLIVVPTSLIFNWKKEIERFLPNFPLHIHHREGRGQLSETWQRPPLILTTYATLRLDAALLSKLSYECVILDEAQAIKNAHTQTFKAVSMLNARFRLSMTGTPIENNLMELWSHFRFLMPDLLGDEASFQAEIQAGLSDSRFLRRIKKKIRPFFLRRRKEEVAKDLPEKVEQIVWVEMGEAQRAVYENFLSGIRGKLIDKISSEGIEKHRMEILEAIMRLRQICCHPLLISSSSLGETAESAKLEALMEDLETILAEGHKVLIYSQFTSMLSLISKRVREKAWKYAYLDGSTQDREKVVNQFQDDPSISLFLISLKAGGIGLNLTAADYVLLYDPWWNEAIENQAIDRAHRIGRQQTVIAKRFIVSETIEEKMMKLKSAKSALAKDLLGEEVNYQGLSADDLLFLLS